MGSGLILLVIVGAWLAVLVPMGLRAHDSAAPSRTTERFSDAMRVLSRRSAVSIPLEEVDDGEVDDGEVDDGEVDEDRADEPERRRSPLAVLCDLQTALAARVPRRALARLGLPRLPRLRAARRTARSSSSPAVRRRRVLLTLTVGAAAALVAGLVGPPALLVVSGVAVGLAVLFAMHCRRQARLRAARLRDQAQAEEGRARRERAVVVPPAAIDRQRVARVDPLVVDPHVLRPPVIHVPVTRTQVAPPVTARVEPAAPAALVRAPGHGQLPAAAGAEWLPVPVPLPLYVGKAAAPSRPAPATGRRQEPKAHDTVLDDPGDERDVALERRQAVGGW